MDGEIVIGKKLSSYLSDNTFFVDSNWYTLQVKDEYVHFECVKKQQPTPIGLSAFNKTLKLFDVISVTQETDEWRVGRNGKPITGNKYLSYFQSHASSCFALVINYCVQMEDRYLKLQSLRLQTFNENNCTHWHEKIMRSVKEMSATSTVFRPRNLLVMVNPNAGNKKAKFAHETIIAPLFEKADIKETVVFTEYKGHAMQYLEVTDLSPYDGIIAVGGDGTFNEVVNGVLMSEQRRKGISLDLENNAYTRKPSYSKPSVRLGHIPVGTANISSHTAHNTNDIETVVLHILYGESHPLDISSVHDNDGTFCRFTVLMSCYGFFSELFRLSNRMRVLGSIRDVIAPAYTFAHLHSFQGEIHYIESCLDGPDVILYDTTRSTRCVPPCTVCLGSNSADSNLTTHFNRVQPLVKPLDCVPSNVNSNVQYNTENVSFDEEKQDKPLCLVMKNTPSCNDDDSCTSTPTAEDSEKIPNVSDTLNYLETNLEWKVIRGSFMMISLTNTKCGHEKAKQGVFPSAHLADGTNDLLIVHETSKKEFANFVNSTYMLGSQQCFPFVEKHRVKAIRFNNRTEKRTSYLRRGSTKHKKQHKVTGEKVNESPSESKNIEHFDKCSRWTSDAETLKSHNVTSWVHQGLVNIFVKRNESY